MPLDPSSPELEALRVLVIGDDPLARSGLVTLLAEQAGLAVVGQAGSRENLLAAVEAYRPGVVLWDLGWQGAPGEGGAELEGFPVPVVLLVPDEAAAEEWVGRAAGMLLRQSEPETIAAALGAAGQGLVVLDPALAPVLLREAPPAPEGSGLTPREQDVLRLLAEGLPNKVIADQLGITEHTVKFHVNAVLGKLGAHSRTEAVTRAARLGLIVL